MLPASMLSFIVPLTLAVVMIVEHSEEIANGAKPLVSMATARGDHRPNASPW